MATVFGIPPFYASGRGAAQTLDRLLGRDLEQLVVESLKLGLTLDELQSAAAAHWRRLTPENLS
jgi:hypothetical protein